MAVVCAIYGRRVLPGRSSAGYARALGTSSDKNWRHIKSAPIRQKPWLKGRSLHVRRRMHRGWGPGRRVSTSRLRKHRWRHPVTA